MHHVHAAEPGAGRGLGRDQPGLPAHDDTLSATVTSHDPDGDPLTTSYQWTVNGSDIGGATSATLNLSAGTATEET